MRVELSLLALQDRNGIFDYLEQYSPAAAVRIDERIGEILQRLGRFPESGRIGRVAGTRELVIVRMPYIAAYQVGSGAVLVLRILHGSQQWPGDF